MVGNISAPSLPSTLSAAPPPLAGSRDRGPPLSCAKPFSLSYPSQKPGSGLCGSGMIWVC